MEAWFHYCCSYYWLLFSSIVRVNRYTEQPLRQLFTAFTLGASRACSCRMKRESYLTEKVSMKNAAIDAGGETVAIGLPGSDRESS